VEYHGVLDGERHGGILTWSISFFLGCCVRMM
jgi:hypothetical protein